MDYNYENKNSKSINNYKRYLYVYNNNEIIQKI